MTSTSIGALVVLLVCLATPLQASDCGVDAGCAIDRARLETACPCASFASHAAYGRCVRGALSRSGSPATTGACRRVLACLARRSICGRSDAVLCCRTTRKRIGAVRRTAARCTRGRRPGTVCPGAVSPTVTGAFASSVDDVCATDGACRVVPPPPCSPSHGSIDFTTASGAGTCGGATDESGALRRPLSCGGLALGGGMSMLPEGTVPSGATNRFLVDCCGDACVLSPTPAPADGWDCTTTGCVFGPPVPIEHGVVSTCLVSRFARPGAGTVDRATGSTADLSIALRTTLVLTGRAGGLYTSPDTVCPVCARDGAPASGTPAVPATGTCNGGARAHLPCSSTNPMGLTSGCLPGDDQSLDLGAAVIDLTPLSTTAVRRTAPDGLFCPGQQAPRGGCFGRVTEASPLGFPECRTIAADGATTGTPLVPDEPVGVTLASVFCVPARESDLGELDPVRFMLDLPGPGAVTLPGTFTFHESTAP